ATLQYQLYDYASGGGYFQVNGVQQTAGQWFTVSGADLANTQYVGGSIPGNETAAVRVSDGMTLSAQQNVTLKSWPHVTNVAPAVSVSQATVGLNDAVVVSSLLPTTDADGDATLQYQLYDYANGGGYFQVNGVQQAAGQWFTVSGADLANTQYVGGSAPGNETTAVRVSDGMTLSAQQNVTLKSWPHATNGAPVVSVSAATVGLNEAVAVSTLLPTMDADGDATLQYQLYDYVNGGGYFQVNGVQKAAGQWFTVSGADLANTQYVGGLLPGNETAAGRGSHRR